MCYTITRELAAKRAIKIYLTTTLRMSRFYVDGTTHTSEPVLRSEVYTLLSVDDIEAAVDAVIACLARRLDAYMTEGSGWTLDAVVDITIHTAAYQPLHVATSIPTPPEAGQAGGNREREEHRQQVLRVGGPDRPPPRRPRLPSEPCLELHRLRAGARHGRHRVPRLARGHRTLRGPERGVGERLRLRGRRIPSTYHQAPRPATPRQPAAAGRWRETPLRTREEPEPPHRPVIWVQESESPVRLLPPSLLPGRPPG